jgi:hypothetical protein
MTIRTNSEQKQHCTCEARPAGRSQALPSRVSTSFAERHYGVAEIAAMWNLSPDKVRRLFENESGVVVLGDEVPNRGKRRYRTLLIPESVVERVHRRLSRV